MGGIEKPTGLDWVQLRKDMDSHTNLPESTWQRIVRKSKENPLVPFGAAVTVGALGVGLYNFLHGRKEMQQKMMRLRVSAQFFTIFVAIGGIFLTLPKEKRNIAGLLESGKSSTEPSK